MRLLLVIVVLVILAVGGLLGYAYLGDMSVDPQEMRIPVELDLDAEDGRSGTVAAETAPTADGEDPRPTAAPAPQATDGQGID